MEKIDIRDVAGFLLGQAQDTDAATGCTVIISPDGAVCGVDIRGGSPGTRDVSALDPLRNRKVVHAVLLAGGSAFGLDAAGGVMRYLEERGVGRDVGVTRVPNVCAAILFDLKCGSHNVRPDVAMGYRACEDAYAANALQSGNFGAGTGATVGKSRGTQFAMKGGVGFAAFRHESLRVGAAVAVNCVGDVLESGKIIAGALGDDGTFADSERVILDDYMSRKDFFSENTVLACIVTNARADKAGAQRVAGHGQNGIVRAIRPAHSIFDGDTVFAMCTGEIDATPDAVGVLAAAAVESAIADAVRSARAYGGYSAAGG
jgi:L-aminopeptidase/D-esterase-like protein